MHAPAERQEISYNAEAGWRRNKESAANLKTA